MRKILITNDDGINAHGIERLARIAKEFGEVWVVAPDSQRSAASHSISLHNPILTKPHDFPVEDVHAFSCSGTPADCIRVGALSVMPEKPDVVLSGINYGWNVASDIQYSATAGAAFEAAFQGIRAIAFSEGTGDFSKIANTYLRDILADLIDRETKWGQIYNVNFPGCVLSDCKGILYDRKVSHGMVFRDRYNAIEESPDGSIKWMVEGIYSGESKPGTDLNAVLDCYISVGVVDNIGS